MQVIRKDTEESTSLFKNYTYMYIIASLSLRKARLKKLFLRDKKKGEGRVKTTPPASDDEASPEHDHRTLKVLYVGTYTHTVFTISPEGTGGVNKHVNNTNMLTKK